MDLLSLLLVGGTTAGAARSFCTCTPIDPRNLRGEAGFYGERDPNCCPSGVPVMKLALQGDSLVLHQQAVRPAPAH